MQNVPNIVRERLKVAAPAVNHPDADVLASFFEKSLSELDRATVLEHLARCADCREVVSLSLPPSEVPATVFVPSGPGWLAWPVLRWGFVSAGILLVTTLGVLQYRRAQSTMTASRQAVPTSSPVAPETQRKASDNAQQAPTVAQVDEAQNSRRSTGTASPSTDKSVAAPKPSSPFDFSMVTKADKPIGGPIPHSAFTYGPKVANQQQQNVNAYQAQAPAAAAAPVAKQVGANVNATAPSPISVHGAVVEKEVASNNEEAVQDLRSLTNAPISEPSGNYGSGELKIDRAKPAETNVRIDGTPKTAAGAVPFQAPVRVGRALAAPRWSITSSGALQRSFDQGNTWQDVNVSSSARSDSFHGAAASLDLAAKASTAKAKDVERDSKTNVPTLIFRAVVANGAEVWAGGSAGMLYHSIDSGVTWLRIIPSSSGADLTGDIVSIQFSDGMHGRVATSTPEVWITSDSGQTWQKQ
jgi:hypothetical protein